MNQKLILRVGALAVALSMLVTPELSAKPKKRKKQPPPVVKVERSETQEYEAPAGVFVNGLEFSACVSGTPCAEFSVLEGEAYMLLEVTDKSGTPAPFSVEINEVVEHFCGTTETPIPTGGDSSIEVRPMAVDQTCSGASATTGSIVATFSNIP